MSSAISLAQIETVDDYRGARILATLGRRGPMTYDVRAGAKNLWITACKQTRPIFGLRCGLEASIEGDVDFRAGDDVSVFTWRTKAGAFRVKICFPAAGETTLRCTTSVLPTREIHVSAATRDLFSLDEFAATVHTTQRGLRSGILFATCPEPLDVGVLYFQDFSSLNEFFEQTQTTPADTVGGTLAEGGYLIPSGERAILPAGREITISDATLAFGTPPSSERELAGFYLDLLAEVYAGLPKAEPEYRDWPLRAQRTLRDLVFSPKCTRRCDGQRYVMPYVGDDTKPPESMVQLTVLVNAIEYERWRGSSSRLSEDLSHAIERFYDPDKESIVRWLPGQPFEKGGEEHMNHETMDSWYLYHALFNLARLATLGHPGARDVLRKSLPYAMRVARRFDYR
ncbi:MAG: hypothetical protein JO199_06900, partial [Candidatus Eremiobacteraeota bacterium]|nr:hypothetical protein [Candidatus Eremiobacteraeota bacterium]